MSDGFARCLNRACEEAGVDRPVEFTVHHREMREPGLPMAVTATDHAIFRAEDLVCPGCGMACAALTEPARVLPKFQPV